MGKGNNSQKNDKKNKKPKKDAKKHTQPRQRLRRLKLPLSSKATLGAALLQFEVETILCRPSRPAAARGCHTRAESACMFKKSLLALIVAASIVGPFGSAAWSAKRGSKSVGRAETQRVTWYNATMPKHLNNYRRAPKR
jgi:hypothetical protein